MAKKEERLTGKDKSNAEMFENSAATKVSGLVTFGIAIVMTIGVYLLLIPFKDVYLGKLFYERGFVQYVLVLLANWALAILFIKSRKIKIQKEVMHYNLLPEDISYKIDGENMEEFEDHIWSLEIRHNESFLVTRILRGLSHFYVGRKHSDVNEVMTGQSEIDFQSVESSYSIIKVFIWAIPIFGFVGTVMGISDAIGSFSSALNGAEDVAVLKNSLGAVTSGLGVAFDTTFLALLLSLVLMFPTTMMQTAEEDFLVSVDEYCSEHFLKRLNADSAKGPKQFSTEEIAEAVDLVLSGSQGALVQKISVLQENLIDVHNNQVDVIEGLNEVSKSHVEKLKAAEQSSYENSQVQDALIEKISMVSDSFSGEELERAVETVLSGVQGSFQSKFGILQDQLTSLHESQAGMVEELNNLASGQIESMKEAQQSSYKSSELMTSSFDRFTEKLSGVSDSFSGKELEEAIKSVLAGVQGSFQSKFSVLEDQLTGLHKGQVDTVKELNDLASGQVERMKKSDQSSQENNEILRSSFDHLIEKLSGVSDSFSGKELEDAIESVLAGVQGSFQSKFSVLEDQLESFHNNQINVVGNLNDLSEKQIDHLKASEESSHNNIEILISSFDRLNEKISTLGDTSGDPENAGRSKKKWLW